MTNSSVDYRLIDSTLRDGSHAISHQYDEDDVIAIVRGLSTAAVQGVDTAHGAALARPRCPRLSFEQSVACERGLGCLDLVLLLLLLGRG